MEGIGKKSTEHEHLAVREVDDFGRLVDDDDAKGDEGELALIRRDDPDGGD